MDRRERRNDISKIKLNFEFGKRENNGSLWIIAHP